MYYPVGLPKRLRIPGTRDGQVKSVVCNRDRILFAILTERAIWIWFSRPCVPVVVHRRSDESVISLGTNELLEWRPDSSMIVVATNKNRLIYYSIVVDESRREVYEQRDPPNPTLKRESAELYTSESIPPLVFSTAFETEVAGGVTGLVCLRDELMVATGTGHIQRLRWDGSLNYDYCVDLRRVPFCDDQLVMKAVPLDAPGVHVIDLEYSPLVGGFAIVLSDGRAAFLTASTLKFDPNAVQGIWARDLEDATCAAINHKYRLLAYGRANSQGVVYTVDEATGGLEVSHRLILSSRDFAGSPGPVGFMKWTPDGTVLGMTWEGGGISLWSVFGSLLTVSLRWDYTEDPLSKAITITNMEWGAEGYEVWCIQKLEELSKQETQEQPLYTDKGSREVPNVEDHLEEIKECREMPQGAAEAEDIEVGAEAMESPHSTGVQEKTCVLQFSFIKSALTVNPCMSRLGRVLLQGNDRLYLNTCEGLAGMPDPTQDSLSLYFDDDEEGAFEDPLQAKDSQFCVAAKKQWIVIPIPYSYTASNWPIRYTCVDEGGELIGVAGRNGVAHYSLRLRRWHLFGNESQERDFVVTGGLLWWRSTWLVLGAYNIPANMDELRLYPRDHKLDNLYVTTVPQPAQVLLLNIYGDQLIVLTADCHITVYNLQPSDTNSGQYRVSKRKSRGSRVSKKKSKQKGISESLLFPRGGGNVIVSRVQEVDISGLTVHPACVVSILLTSLRTESWRVSNNQHNPLPAQSVIINISGKVLMIQRDQQADGAGSNGKLFHCAQMTPIVLASSCEALWCSSCAVSHKPHLSHALWLHCGVHGTRAWLPLFPNSADKSHIFLARRIMLPFTPSIYPLAVLFEEGILLGAETDTSLLACDAASLHQPLTVVERTSQVYLHHLLRQLLRRNLGYHAWEVASTCRDLPYFPHALELLLHQVLEEEASSKDPLPDCLLPRVVEFIREFPVYLQTVVQCARKTELALWRYLFSAAGSPKLLFVKALEEAQLDTAASYLIILQNLESASVSRSHATRLLDATLEAGKWDLSKDLIRFLRSIDPTDLDSPKPSVPSCGSTKVGFSHATPPVSPACADEDLSMILPNTQVLRGRSFSSTSAPKVAVGDGAAVSHQSVVRTTSDSAKVLPEISRQCQTVPTQRKRSTNSLSKDVSTAEEYFLDVILQRHAKKLLLSCRLRDLGTMAAHLDFPLVSWLRRERSRAARVDDFVASLKHIHREFSWPYPSVPTSHIRRYSVSSVRSGGSPDERSVLVEEKMQGLSISVPKVSSLGTGEVGDSGYMSQATGDTHTAVTPQHTPHSPKSPYSLQEVMPRQALLVPHSPRTGDTVSVMSEEGTLYGDDTSSVCGDWSPEGGDPMRDLLSRPPDPPPQSSPRPPPHAEVQLRYLLQVLLEAGCLEWSVVVAVVLRDALAVLRVVTLARAPDVPAQVITRLTTGLQDLLHFTNTECLGYQNFLGAIMGQVKVLERLANTREISRTPSPHSSRPPSTSHESEPPPSQESSHRSSVRTSPPPSSHQQQGQQQQSIQVQNQTQSQQAQQLPQQQAQQPLPHPGMPKVSYLPRNSISAGETLQEETSNTESENELTGSVHEGISTLEEEGSAACVVS
ncbi:guanine nucleotide exchange factor subunit Rich-like isoform X2 [Penaeus japonicus]|uniref:guanine nucleotide exchange factor subunit Rich-like isoform X2 n=1 Tax=Penaeus japonicus TaxID=27405 RepID=UPI001C71456C|nr:guanine nucleotide exchange factor subunit Rich-like isoform X2 [Penaeus japonicus]